MDSGAKAAECREMFFLSYTPDRKMGHSRACLTVEPFRS